MGRFGLGGFPKGVNIESMPAGYLGHTAHKGRGRAAACGPISPRICWDKVNVDIEQLYSTNEDHL